MKKSSLFATAVLSLLVAGAVQAQPVMRDGALADATGRTVYTFDKDAANKSNCAGGCLAAWPAFTAKAMVTAKVVPGTLWAARPKPLHPPASALRQCNPTDIDPPSGLHGRCMLPA